VKHIFHGGKNLAVLKIAIYSCLVAPPGNYEEYVYKYENSFGNT